MGTGLTRRQMDLVDLIFSSIMARTREEGQKDLSKLEEEEEEKDEREGKEAKDIIIQSGFVCLKLVNGSQYHR